MEEEQGKYIPPKPTAGDAIHTIVRAGVSAIPVAGGPAAEVFSMILVPPISRRRDEWMETVAEGLQRLEHKVEGFSIEGLSENDSFVSTLLDATQIAIRNHQQEKLDALRNAVLNSALPDSLDDDIRAIYVQLVDSLTVLHMRVLRIYDNPLEWAKKHGIKYPSPSEGMYSESRLLEFALPELKDQHALISLIVTELFSRGLTQVSHWSGSLPDSLTSGMGKEFLAFITEPHLE